MRALVISLLLAGCSSKHASEGAAPPALKLVDRAAHEIATLTADDKILDANGVAVGRFDAATNEVIVGATRDVAAYDTEPPGIAIRTTMGEWHVRVTADELQIDGNAVGMLTGFTASKEGWRRLAGLVLAIPMLPVAERPRDAAVAVDAASSESAPPPPPPR